MCKMKNFTLVVHFRQGTISCKQACKNEMLILRNTVKELGTCCTVDLTLDWCEKFYCNIKQKHYFEHGFKTDYIERLTLQNR